MHLKVEELIGGIHSYEFLALCCIFYLPFSLASVPVHGNEDISGTREQCLQATLLRVIAEVTNEQTVGRGTSATPTTTTYTRVHTYIEVWLRVRALN